MSQVAGLPPRQPTPGHRSKWYVLGALAAPLMFFGAFYVSFIARAEPEAPPKEKPAVAAPEPEEPAPPAAPPVAQNQAQDERIKAPELEGGIEWLNTSGPVRLKDLRGKIVLLDFWTYCCINCLHVLPDLEKLEKKYPNQLVVIGVHSAKFDTEKDSKSIRDAILRYNIEHPVVNDANHKIWQAYAVRSWPSFWLIDPEGYLFGRDSGEGLYEALDRAIGHLIETHRKKKTLNEQPLRFDLAKYSQRKDSPLFFPGKLLADVKGDRLFIADSSHHRVVVTDLSGKKRDVIGAGQEGRQDGPFDKASFNDPQGLALVGDVLYVADRKNHLIRAVDLKKRLVSTVAGTGEQGRDRQGGGKGREVSLNSPWDLWLHGSFIYIAMAGHHQIWRLDLQTQEVAAFAGNGREDILDGTLRRSMFAQPSGLASDGAWLYVADSEVSAVRAVSLKEHGAVKTLVGEGLFDFGDTDGVGDAARLQHCLAVACYQGKVYVADTYNNKIKVIDPETRKCESYLGDGKPGKEDKPPRFDEPAGLAIAGDKLYVADTNNHLIRVVDLKTKQVSTLALSGLEPPKLPSVTQRPVFLNPTIVKAAEVPVPTEGEITLQVNLNLPAGTKLNPLAPVQYLLEFAAGAGAPQELVGKLDQPKGGFDLKLPAEKLAAAKSLKVSVSYVTCAEGSEGVCTIKSHVWEVPLRTEPGAKARVVELQIASTEK